MSNILVGAITPQEVDSSDDISDWREPVEWSNDPVCPEPIDMVPTDKYGVGFNG